MSVRRLDGNILSRPVDWRITSSSEEEKGRSEEDQENILNSIPPKPYPQKIKLPIKIIANNCQLQLIVGSEKSQLIAN